MASAWVGGGCAGLGAGRPAEEPAGPAAAWQVERGWLCAAGVAEPGPGPAAEVQVAELGWLGAGLPPEPETTDASQAGAVRIRYRGPAAEFTDQYEPFPRLGPGAWRRHLAYTNRGSGPQDVTGVRLHLRPCAARAAWAPATFRMYEAPAGRLLCVANWGETDFVHFEDGDGGPRSVFGVAWRLAPGQTATVASQIVWVADGTVPDATRVAARRAFRALGFEAPVAYPEWLTRGVLYEASAAGHIDSRFSDTGGFDAFARQVPYLADLGVTALWLNAVQAHKSPPDPVKGGWNHYDPSDFQQIDPVLGGADGLARLDRTLREHGVHLISEIVPHGGRSVQAQALPQAWTRGRDGTLQKNWGGCGMDLASPEWQAVLRDSMAMVSGVATVEGARVDVADGQGPHWGSPRTPHASQSGLLGASAALRAIAAGIASGGVRDPVLIPESGARPEYFALAGMRVLGYGFETTHALQRLSTAVYADPPELNRQLRDLFEAQRGSLPPGALLVQTLDNHDTVCDVGRVHARFGVGLHRALYAVCLAVPGVPMLMQEEEVGSFDALRRLHRARQQAGDLATAAAEYPPAGWFAPGVFATWRGEGRERVLCLVNLGGQPATGQVDLPAGWRPRGLVDTVSGRRVALGTKPPRLSWTLAAYEAAFLCPEPARRRAPAPAAADAGPAGPTPTPRLTVEPLADGALAVRLPGLTARLRLAGPGAAESARAGALRCTAEADGTVAVRCELRAATPGLFLGLQVEGASEWGVSGRTGLLLDRVVDRHGPFPDGSGYRWTREHAWGWAPWGGLYRGVCPSGRLWQSLLEPLHPQRPAVGFAAANGSRFTICDLRTDAMNTVLTDASDETGTGAAGLELRVYAVDPDLDARVQQFGRGQPWTVPALPAAPARPLTVTFRLAACAEALATTLAVEALPCQPQGAWMSATGSPVHDMGGRQFLPLPGTLAWSGLAPVPGRYRLRLELRLSERSATDEDLRDAYRVRLDGVDLPLEWGQKDVWHTGNAYFAYAVTPAVDLAGRVHELSVQSVKPWCAVRRGFDLLPAESTGPGPVGR